MKKATKIEDYWLSKKKNYPYAKKRKEKD